MAVLNPVVGVPTNLLFVGVAKFGHRCTVGAQAVRRTEHTSLKSVEAPLNCDPAELAKSSAWRWAMIALTRPIDTLVIACSDPRSTVGKVLWELAASRPDLIGYCQTNQILVRSRRIAGNALQKLCLLAEQKRLFR